MDISVITPAHNEEKFIGKCTDSVKAAAEFTSLKVEHIVVVNRCSDQTEETAKAAGCTIVHEDARNISRIRNAGAAVAQGKILTTIDADSWISANMLAEVVRLLETGRFIGGGVLVRPERWSPGIFCSLLVVVAFVFWHRVGSAGMFWCYKKDFDAIGGFDESLICVEDVDFAKRLRKHGKAKSKKYGTIRKARMTTSCRKFDQFGDWCLIRNPKTVLDIFNRKQEAADRFYYDFENDVSAR